jgi:hypothetical protein
MVSKIELVDGSDVLYSLSGYETQALNFYEAGEMPAHALMYVNDVQSIEVFNISFGRFLWDDKLALDPSRFANLQLKITHNKASGGGAPDAGEISVFAHVMEKTDASPTGFLMAKEIQSYALAANAHEYISLPLDYAYRKIILKSLFTLKQPWEHFNRIKLSVDNDRQVLINNLKTSDLIKLFSSQEIIETIVSTGTGSAETTYVTPTMWMFGGVAPLNSALAASTILTQGYGGTMTILADSTELIQGILRGQCPHGAVQLPFGVQEEIAKWLDVSKMGSLKLDITGGSSIGAAATCEVFAQQYRTYK